MIEIKRKARRRTLVADTCATLAKEIRSAIGGPVGAGWLPPERELASRLGVSRTVIREATKRLELQGLLSIHHGKGLKVVDDLHKPLSESLRLDIPDQVQRLRQLSETRRIIEPEAARWAAERARPRDLKSLRAIHERLRLAGDLGQAADADVAFHHAVALAAGNAIIALLLRSLGELNRASRIRTLGATGIARAWEHHGEILAAIEARDAEAAAARMRHHVEEAARDLEGQPRALETGA